MRTEPRDFLGTLLGVQRSKLPDNPGPERLQGVGTTMEYHHGSSSGSVLSDPPYRERGEKFQRGCLHLQTHLRKEESRLV